MKSTLLWLTVVLLAGSCVIASPGSAAPIADPATGHAYELVLTPDLTWNQAVDAAAQMNWAGREGHLATITTLAEHEFIIVSLGGGPQINYCWVGGYQDRSAPDFSEPFGGWKWITGETWLGSGPEAPTFSFNNTYSDYTSEEYLITWWGTGGLNDFSESGSGDSRGFIVEYEPTASAVFGSEPGSVRVLMGSPSPNPFNPRTTICFELPESGHVRLSICDLRGRLVRTLVDADLSSGGHQTAWDGKDMRGAGVSSGTYLARIDFGTVHETKRLTLIK
jgi:hypothetical protein